MRALHMVVVILFAVGCSASERNFEGATSGSGSTGAGAAGAGGAGAGGAGAGGGQGGSSASQGGGGAGACNGSVVQIPNVTASSAGFGTCCSGGFPALTDGSGLTGLDETALHDCNDGSMWKSEPGQLAGVLGFDLGGLYEIHAVVAWNSAQVGGERGVRSLTMTVSEDGNSFDPLHGSPTMLQMQTVCPSASEVFFVEPVQKGRHVRFTIEDSYTNGGATNLGLGEVWFYGASCQ